MATSRSAIILAQCSARPRSDGLLQTSGPELPLPRFPSTRAPRLMGRGPPSVCMPTTLNKIRTTGLKPTLQCTPVWTTSAPRHLGQVFTRSAASPALHPVDFSAPSSGTAPPTPFGHWRELPTLPEIALPEQTACGGQMRPHTPASLSAGARGCLMAITRPHLLIQCQAKPQSFIEPIRTVLRGFLDNHGHSQPWRR